MQLLGRDAEFLSLFAILMILVVAGFGAAEGSEAEGFRAYEMITDKRSQHVGLGFEGWKDCISQPFSAVS